MKRSKRVTSPDNWHYTADDGTVQVSIHHYDTKGPSSWGVSVWGEDDYGMDLPGLDCATAFEVFRRIGDGITKEELARRGFRDAN